MKLLNRLSCVPMLALIAAALSGPAAAQLPPPELLDAEQAFQVSARFLDANTVALSFRIADGYYMYRERFKFNGASGQPAFGTARIPAGKIKQDATFGRVETYRKTVQIVLPLSHSNVASPAKTAPVDVGAESKKFVVFEVTSQGCADAGICYPPQRHQFRLERGSLAITLPEAATTSGFSSAIDKAPSGASSVAPAASGKISDQFKRAP